jgi:hypothetical protein
MLLYDGVYALLNRSRPINSPPGMGFLLARSYIIVVAALCVVLPCHAKLSTKFYAKTCPNVESIVRAVMAPAVAAEPRIGASIIRLFFHDCFVNVSPSHLSSPLLSI